VHGRLAATPPFRSVCSEAQKAKNKCLGGAARLAGAIADIRSTTDNVVLLDAGDQFQGTLFYTNYKGSAAAQEMNPLGYDAMAVGNHEFDDGPAVLARFIEGTDFPQLAVNMATSDKPQRINQELAAAAFAAESFRADLAGHKVGREGIKIGAVQLAVMNAKKFLCLERNSPGRHDTHGIINWLVGMVDHVNSDIAFRFFRRDGETMLRHLLAILYQSLEAAALPQALHFNTMIAHPD